MSTLLESDLIARTNQTDMLHFRLPQELTPTPHNPLNIQNLDDMIVAGMLVQLMRMGNRNVNVSTLAKFSGRSNKRVKSTLERLQERGFIEMRKVRNEYDVKKFGYRWRIWIPTGSPLNKLLHAQKGDGFKWVAVPLSVGRFRSPLATALYMMLHLQKFVDGAITTTIADIAFALNCDRKTARRLLSVVGAKQVFRKGYANAVYDMPTVYSRNLTLKQQAHNKFLMAEMVKTLSAHGILLNIDHFDKYGNGKTAIAILELEYSHILMQHEQFRSNIITRLGRGFYNKRVKDRRLKKVTRRETDQSALSVQLIQADITSALNKTCSACNGDMFIEVIEDGVSKLKSCSHCHPVHHQ